MCGREKKKKWKRLKCSHFYGQNVKTDLETVNIWLYQWHSKRTLVLLSFFLSFSLLLALLGRNGRSRRREKHTEKCTNNFIAMEWGQKYNVVRVNVFVFAAAEKKPLNSPFSRRKIKCYGLVAHFALYEKDFNANINRHVVLISLLYRLIGICFGFSLWIHSFARSEIMKRL